MVKNQKYNEMPQLLGKGGEKKLMMIETIEQMKRNTSAEKY